MKRKMTFFEEITNFKFIIFFTIITAIAGCSTKTALLPDFKDEQIIHYSQMKDKDDLSNYVMYLDKGDVLPVRISLDSGLFDTADEQVNLVCKQRVYFRFSIPAGMNAKKTTVMNEKEKQKLIKAFMIYLSPDAKRWALYTDIKSLEQLFGVKGGSFSFGMGITKENGLKVMLNMKTNRL